MAIRDYNFGDYSGLREYRRNRSYFLNSFISPQGFRLSDLRNDRNYILVGRKGTGKSTCCLAHSADKRNDGYTCTFFNFSDDLNSTDLRDAVRTQHLSFNVEFISKLQESISEMYDFRDLWKRKVLITIAKDLLEKKQSSRFTDVASQIYLPDESISDGVLKGLRINVAKFAELLPEGWGGPTGEKGEVELRKYNKVLLGLLATFHSDLKFYYFFDELNISHTKSNSDEYETLIALVRDIVRSTSELNDFFVENGLDCHIICCLRPEVRNEVLARDNELSKVIDSNFVSLSWPVRANAENPLMDLLRSKIKHGKPEDSLEDIVIPEEVFSVAEKKQIPFPSYFLNLTWYRPRDVVRVLKCYQVTNGSKNVLFGPNDSHFEFLKEYSRVSFTDNVAELEVKYSRAIIKEAFNRVKRYRYENVDDFKDDISIISNRVHLEEFIVDLFDNGFIYNFIRSDEGVELAASYRDDHALRDDLPLFIHRGIQPYLGLGLRYSPQF